MCVGVCSLNDFIAQSHAHVVAQPSAQPLPHWLLTSGCVQEVSTCPPAGTSTRSLVWSSSFASSPRSRANTSLHPGVSGREGCDGGGDDCCAFPPSPLPSLAAALVGVVGSVVDVGVREAGGAGGRGLTTLT